MWKLHSVFCTGFNPKRFVNSYVINSTKKFLYLHSSRISRLRCRHSGFVADICCILSYPPRDLSISDRKKVILPLTRISAALVKIEFGMPLPVVASIASGKWSERITPFKSVVNCRTRSISPSTFLSDDQQKKSNRKTMCSKLG